MERVGRKKYFVAILNNRVYDLFFLIMMSEASIKFMQLKCFFGQAL